MTPVGLIGVFLSLLALPLSSSRLTQGRTLICLALIITHLASCLVYFTYVQGNSADSRLYYFDPLGMSRWSFQLSTVFTVKLVQFLRDIIGGSYLDYFLIFQSIGLLGIAFVMRTFEELCTKLDSSVPPLAYLLLFLPGIHFWTSAIGKDAPLFFAMSMAMWSILRLRGRLPYFVLSLAIMTLFRPHIALITLMALAIAALFGGQLRFPAKIGLLAFALSGAAATASTVETTFRVSVSNPGSVADFFARTGEVTEKVGGTTAVHGASFPFKLFSLLFRPLFVDANGAFGMIASMENLIIFLIVAYLVKNIRETILLVHSVFFLRFAIILAALLSVLLAMVYYNVGLGLRQKMMIMPAILSFFVAHWVYHTRVRLAQPEPVAATA